MKRRIQTAMILAALICMSLSGCVDSATEPTSTSVTDTIVKTSVTSVTTVTTEVSVTEVTEKTTIPSTAEETTETDTDQIITVTTVTAPQTETPKVNEEPTEYYEPIETTIAIITDDTKLAHKEFCNAENMNRVASGLVDYYIAKGMKYDNSISTSNSGWMYVYQGQVDGQAVRSYNEHWERIVIGMDEQLEAFMTMYPEAKYTDLSFNCYEELQPDGEYDIYFCYK